MTKLYSLNKIVTRRYDIISFLANFTKQKEQIDQTSCA